MADSQVPYFSLLRGRTFKTRGIISHLSTTFEPLSFSGYKRCISPAETGNQTIRFSGESFLLYRKASNSECVKKPHRNPNSLV